ncbi:TIGR03086 family metal-binding protein [Aldersonia sp. NBC_00410]|uniref:TIGR03086 family metal-binding protein n=1 Tax=Aldersonia sp. NBC_00410 TaxID=2975954 RepID=UPI00224E5BF3|nr:TIGR03086 family metal-binding protein [Aldersonia sp. NBC_00410]MCX5046596.1 TIGR03086 family metal-binding protein [Aldersonia sp. NBC_00410]
MTVVVEDLARASDTVGDVIAHIAPDQWELTTPCTEWNVRRLVGHLVAGNLIFVARLGGGAMPEQGSDLLGDDPTAAFRETAADLQAALRGPGVLDRRYPGPLGVVTGAETLQIRLYDLLVHGWDLGRATGIAADLPNDLAAQSLLFVRDQLATMPRTGRFAEPQSVAPGAPSIDQLAAFLGRQVEPSG